MKQYTKPELYFTELLFEDLLTLSNRGDVFENDNIIFDYGSL